MVVLVFRETLPNWRSVQTAASAGNGSVRCWITPCPTTHTGPSGSEVHERKDLELLADTKLNLSKQCTLAAKAANSIWGALQRLQPALPERCWRLFPGDHSALLVRHIWGDVRASGLCGNEEGTDVLEQECSKGPLS